MEKAVVMEESKGFSQLLDRVWCPICGGELEVKNIDGKRMLNCTRDGAMKAYLDKDPYARNAFVEQKRTEPTTPKE
jgi:hypothetical protein